MNTRQLLPLAILMIVSFFSCEENASEPALATGDYFPLKDGQQWRYSQTLTGGGMDSNQLDDLHLKVYGDTLIGDKRYSRIIDEVTGFTVKVVRKEGSRYFGRNHELYGGFTHEYVFLDTEVGAGDSWEYFKFDGAIKTVYNVKSVNATRTVANTTYENALELRVDYYSEIAENQYELSYSVVHVYVKDVGEIYSYYPYPASNFFADLSTELISFRK